MYEDYPRCGCRQYCADLPETHDDPDATCKGLPYAPKPPLVEVVTVPRSRLPEEGEHS